MDKDMKNVILYVEENPENEFKLDLIADTQNDHNTIEYFEFRFSEKQIISTKY